MLLECEIQPQAYHKPLSGVHSVDVLLVMAPQSLRYLAHQTPAEPQHSSPPAPLLLWLLPWILTWWADLQEWREASSDAAMVAAARPSAGPSGPDLLAALRSPNSILRPYLTLLAPTVLAVLDDTAAQAAGLPTDDLLFRQRCVVVCVGKGGGGLLTVEVKIPVGDLPSAKGSEFTVIIPYMCWTATPDVSHQVSLVSH